MPLKIVLLGWLAGSVIGFAITLYLVVFAVKHDAPNAKLSRILGLFAGATIAGLISCGISGFDGPTFLFAFFTIVVGFGAFVG